MGGGGGGGGGWGWGGWGGGGGGSEESGEGIFVVIYESETSGESSGAGHLSADGLPGEALALLGRCALGKPAVGVGREGLFSEVDVVILVRGALGVCGEVDEVALGGGTADHALLWARDGVLFVVADFFAASALHDARGGRADLALLLVQREGFDVVVIVTRSFQGRSVGVGVGLTHVLVSLRGPAAATSALCVQRRGGVIVVVVVLHADPLLGNSRLGLDWDSESHVDVVVGINSVRVGEVDALCDGSDGESSTLG